jgi:hypothetical protein
MSEGEGEREREREGWEGSDFNVHWMVESLVAQRLSECVWLLSACQSVFGCSAPVRVCFFNQVFAPFFRSCAAFALISADRGDMGADVDEMPVATRVSVEDTAN